eukprot:5234316-Pleurochrysis_carterae.AAC.3
MGCGLQTQVDAQQKELSACSQRVTAEKQELIMLRSRCKGLQKTLAGYQVKYNRKFFEVEPLAEENEKL